MAKHEFNKSDEDLKQQLLDMFLLRAPLRIYDHASKSYVNRLPIEDYLADVQIAFDWIKKTDG